MLIFGVLQDELQVLSWHAAAALCFNPQFPFARYVGDDGTEGITLQEWIFIRSFVKSAPLMLLLMTTLTSPPSFI